MVELGPAECIALLGSVQVGRVGVTIDALPAVLPVNFVVWNGSIVFRTVPGTKLDAAAAGDVVAFEVDGYGSQEQARRVERPRARHRPRDRPIRPSLPKSTRFRSTRGRGTDRRIGTSASSRR